MTVPERQGSIFKRSCAVICEADAYGQMMDLSPRDVPLDDDDWVPVPEFDEPGYPEAWRYASPSIETLVARSRALRERAALAQSATERIMLRWAYAAVKRPPRALAVFNL